MVDGSDSSSSSFRFTDVEHGYKILDSRLLPTADGGRSWTPLSLGYLVAHVAPPPKGRV